MLDRYFLFLPRMRAAPSLEQKDHFCKAEWCLLRLPSAPTAASEHGQFTKGLFVWPMKSVSLQPRTCILSTNTFFQLGRSQSLWEARVVGPHCGPGVKRHYQNVRQKHTKLTVTRPDD